MKQSKQLVPLVLASVLLSPSAFSQVLGAGAGGGLQVGPAHVGVQARGEAGVRGDAVRDAARQVRDTAVDAGAKGDAAVRSSLQQGADARAAAVTETRQAAGHAGHLGAQAAANASLGAKAAAGSAAADHTGHAAGVIGTLGADDSAPVAGAVNAQGSAHASEQAKAAVAGNPTAASHSAITAETTVEASAQAGKAQAKSDGRTDSKATGKAAIKPSRDKR